MDLQQHLDDGVVSRVATTSDFKCTVCGMQFSGETPILQHLGGRQHREAGARYMLANPGRECVSLRRLVKPVVLAAAGKGEVQAAGAGFRCNLCEVTISGATPLEDHLNSNSHKKHSANDSHVLRPFLEDGVVSRGASSNIFRCCVCCVDLTGQASTQQHLEGKQHREAGAKYVLGNPWDNRATLTKLVKPTILAAAKENVVQVVDTGFRCVRCKVTLLSLTPLEDHLSSNGHKNTHADEETMVFQHPDLRQFLEEGIVIQCYPGNIFKCSVCHVDLTGETPTLQHVEGKQHREAGARHLLANPKDKRASLRTLVKSMAIAAAEAGVVEVSASGFKCTACAVTLSGVAPLEEHLVSNNHKKRVDQDKTPNSCEAVTALETALEKTLVIRPLPAAAPTPSQGTRAKSKYVYSVISEPRGLVYVFNYTFKGQGKLQRNGAHLDSVNIQKTFEKLGYQIIVLEDLTGEETFEQFEKIRENPELNGVDVLMVFILSHGVDPYTFLANDGTEVNLHSIRFGFSDRKCPYMRNKPKIFFANYCRADRMERRELKEAEEPSDMATIHAAAEGVLAKRSPDFGTVFVKSLCDVLDSHGLSLDLRDLYIELWCQMKENDGTKPMWEDYVFKKFFLGPR
ncbi:zinc finger protein 346 isoform X4 [Penaeus vannamei]|uniref:zinc finger protein 346 isoform X4 n=1 Tax=Penaeus vannamei TaxID=6689 RepID=UPI00387F8638